MPRRELCASIGSTQARAIEWARLGAEPGTYLVARRQTEGRGRLDHRWASPPGGLYLSWIGPPSGAEGPALSVLLGGGLQALVASRWRLPVLVKWPNDLVADTPVGRPRKLGGILAEQVHGKEGYRTVVGVGLNVSPGLEEFPEEIRGTVIRWTDLAPAVPDLDELEGWVVGRIEEVMSDVDTPLGRDRWWMRAREALYGRGRAVRIDGTPVGILRDLAPSGALRVEGPTGTVEYLTGELSWEAPA
jgi:BirA family biotin operon repressor/biotin-[acetyl-CoA-carboxylase] ligase